MADEANDSSRDLLDMAPVFALDAVTPDECRELAERLAEADPEVAERFGVEVREVREVLAAMSAGTATEPPPGLRVRLLDLVHAELTAKTPAEKTHTERPGDPEATEAPRAEDDHPPPPVSLDERRQARQRNFLLAAAAAVIVAIGGVVVAGQWQNTSEPGTSERVFAAEDVRTSSGELDGGGTATVVFSKEEDAGVLVMNNVAPPAEGSVYQMWLVGPEGMEPAGTMTPDDVAPSTTAVLEDISGATALAFSVEPTGGSTQPTAIFAQLPLD
ncbi:anti-sigma factor [Rhodococcus sp. 2G]|uniref:anti-sigma factor n=1 Tax=unclassified Rhodococcus (in: high G+C Gram-positive bacteria) TaxID=192944 RepID=UPI0007D9C9DE|nr:MULTISPECIES: anti-sigma factor [unclassified Rhodococcus (in: high G+C Gram-positive bacteria)]APE11290.1 anti-sigma factor [Rhodococcus sp. 2G]